MIYATKPRYLLLSLRTLSGLVLAALIAGCTSLSSETIEELAQQGKPPSGVRYCLPKSEIPLILSVDAAKTTFTVTAGALRSVQDERHCHYLNYRSLPQYHDTITVEIGPAGYLKNVSSNTRDQTVEIIKNIGKTFGAFQHGLESVTFPATDAPLSTATFDPTDPSSVVAAQNKFATALTAHATEMQNAVCKKAAAAAKAGKDGIAIPDLTASIQCEEYKRYAGMKKPLELLFIRIDRTHLGHLKSAEPSSTAKQANCSVGICYRVPEPWELIVAIGTVQKGSGEKGYDTISRTTYLVPNKSRLVEIDFNRALLVDKVQTISFTDDGILESLSVKKDSELLALSSIPIEVIGAIADGLKIRILYMDEKIKEVNADKALIEARTELEKQRLLLESYGGTRSYRPGAATHSRVPNSISATTPPPLDRVDPVD